jgi:hypothetical protein
MQYPCVASSIEGFVQQIAVSYVGRGYWFYVTGRVPERKDPRATDEKLVGRYGVGLSKWSRARRKRAGWANVQYIRHERLFVLLATHGRHPFFEQEAGLIKDARRTPIKLFGYAVSYRGGHAHVRIEQGQYAELKAFFLEAAARRPAAWLGRELGRLPFEPYAPVRGQLLGILRAVNRARDTAGLEAVPATCLRLRRRVYRPFEAGEREAGEEDPA